MGGGRLFRIVTRVALVSTAIALLVMGAIGIALGAISKSTMSPQIILRSVAQSIDVPGCSTLVVELASVRVDAGRWMDAPLLQQRGLLTVTPVGSTDGTWLIGAADSEQIEAQLLGARYCLAERVRTDWSVSSISVDESDPDVRLDGVPGLWARVLDGQPAVLPVPANPKTIVVTGDDTSNLTKVELSGEVRFEGADEAARIALFGGIGSSALGLILLVIGIVGLRRKGRHEGSASQDAASPLGGEP